MLDVEKIKQLIEVMVANDLVEVSLRDGDVEVNLRRPNLNGQAVVATTDVGVTAAGAATNPVSAATKQPAADQEPAAPDSDDAELVEISSPMVGTFYAATDPEAPPFMTTGTEVHPGTVVCILEAMKVFNEIKAEISGRIERILVKNADPVEYGQPLFLVRPL